MKDRLKSITRYRVDSISRWIVGSILALGLGFSGNSNALSYGLVKMPISNAKSEGNLRDYQSNRLNSGWYSPTSRQTGRDEQKCLIRLYAVTEVEWQIDSLAATNGSNAQVEGDDATADAIVATTRRANYTQISRKVVQVSGTDRAVRNAGRKDELGYQLMKSAKALKRDMEVILTANAAYNAGNSSTARVTAGIDSWIYTNATFLGATGAANPATPDGTHTRTDGTNTVAVTEANVKTVLANIFTAGGDPEYSILSAVNKQIFSGFTGNVTRFNDISERDKKLFAAYDVYVSDFGEIKLVPDRFSRSRDIFFIDPDYIKVAYLRPFETVPLSKTGDSDRKMLIVEYALEMSNEKASGGIFDTTG